MLLEQAHLLSMAYKFDCIVVQILRHVSHIVVQFLRTKRYIVVTILHSKPTIIQILQNVGLIFVQIT